MTACEPHWVAHRSDRKVCVKFFLNQRSKSSRNAPVYLYDTICAYKSTSWINDSVTQQLYGLQANSVTIQNSQPTRWLNAKATTQASTWTVEERIMKCYLTRRPTWKHDETLEEYTQTLFVRDQQQWFDDTGIVCERGK